MRLKYVCIVPGEVSNSQKARLGSGNGKQSNHEALPKSTTTKITDSSAHGRLVTAYISVKIVSGIDLSDGTKLLTKLMLTKNQLCSMAFTRW